MDFQVQFSFLRSNFNLFQILAPNVVINYDSILKFTLPNTAQTKQGIKKERGGNFSTERLQLELETKYRRINVRWKFRQGYGTF